MSIELNEIIIRDVQAQDMPAIKSIYELEVLHGISSWEDLPPSLDEMIERKNKVVQAGYPYRVACLGDQLLGYAYASAYRSRPAYRFTVENSIYLADGVQRMGVGQKLLTDLVQQCEVRGFRQMIAVVGGSDNHVSINFHKKMGFEQVGLVKNIGHKFDQWLDSVMLQLPLGKAHKSAPGKLDKS
jgi:phosphinothricin acetyltransferase